MELSIAVYVWAMWGGIATGLVVYLWRFEKKHREKLEKELSEYVKKVTGYDPEGGV